MARDTLIALKKRLKLRNKRPKMSQFIKQIILHTFNNMQIKATAESQCKRKLIAASILEIDIFNEIVTHHAATNNPVSKNITCVGTPESGKIDCGCIHAEAAVIIKFLKSIRRIHRKNVRTILISTHTPCIQCANLIIETGLIDVVAYDYFCGGGYKRLNNNLQIWSKEQIEYDSENKLIEEWTKLNAN